MAVEYSTLRIKTGAAADPDPAAIGSVFVPPEAEVWHANRGAKGAFFRLIYAAVGTSTVIIYTRDQALFVPNTTVAGLWAVHGTLALNAHGREFLQDDLGEHDFWVGFAAVTAGVPPIILRVAELR